ncbi:hypothetical protein VE01_03127 [Pseudogymnoascus verrucosus]|uniref:ER membrane protein complex subunit 7 beta-sandwich domain-containing protein n=1 Tax=Pseudogymnoascus verrucosus TaxID=342668 RepID=A0A1B8GRD2_9PEZI|nr:uncharacterized protein VE01_03127 [Pseudogymnoascus verrucosus]OBT98387.1 hypothetical protein VE01_03127 [Pseudogymnoascus verrucosus]
MHLPLPHLLLPLLPLTLALHLRVLLPPTASLLTPSLLPPSTTASLTTQGHVYTAPLGASSTFDFRNVSAGSYLLDVVGSTHVFAPLRVDISEGNEGGAEVVKAWGTWRGNEWENKGEVVEVGVWGREGRVVEVKAVGAKEYLIERTGFSPLSILKNPMILMAGVAMLMMFGMPKLMENMDPETRAEFEERQKSSPMNGLLNGQAAQGGAASFDAAAWLAGAPAKKQAAVEKGVTR